jgi:Multicopper oxidase
MTIIASEISYVHPIVIDSFFSLPGERFDFVLNAYQKPKDYWIRIQTMYPCRELVESFAILRYGEDHRISAGQRVAFTGNVPERFSTEFALIRMFNSPLPKVKDIPILSLKAFDSDHSIILNPPDHKFHLFLDSPTILDDTLDQFGNYYRLSCE